MGDFIHDDLNRLDRMTEYRTDGSAADIADLSDNTVIADYDYTVRDDGKRTSLTETFEGGLTNTYNWTYDKLDRLVEEEINSSDGRLFERNEFDYDLTGNRTEQRRFFGVTSIPDETITYGHDANDRLTSESSSLGKSTTYSYDHTQQTGKSVTNADTSTVVTAFTYDLQGRMETATITQTDAFSVTTQIEKTTYDYDAKGLRTSALQEIDSNADSTWDTRTRTEFLVDHHNHTGYQQVVRETHFDADTDTVTKTVDYSFGHDEITQTTRDFDGQGTVTSDVTLVFGHDGHGNVRVLTDMAAAVSQLFAYDAWGQMLGILDGSGTMISGALGVYADASLAATTLLYSGEQFDTRIGQQYLRARYYDPTTGTFNRLDPFFGNMHDPQSFHKYLYTHADPVNNIDPTGLMSLGSVKVGIAIGAGLNAMLAGAYGAAKGWSTTEIALASAASFGATIAVAGLFFGTAGFFVAHGVTKATAFTATSIMYGVPGAGLAVKDTFDAFRDGDEVDQAFATFNLALAAYGAFRTGLSVAQWNVKETAMARAAAERLAAIREGHTRGAVGVFYDPDTGTFYPGRSTTAGGRNSPIDDDVQLVLDAVDEVIKAERGARHGACVEPRCASSVPDREALKRMWSAVVTVAEGRELSACRSCTEVLSAFGISDATRPEYAPLLLLIAALNGELDNAPHHQQAR